jgi:hypothetical protein
MTKPNGLDLEHRLRGAIEGATTSTELAALLRESEEAIGAAEEAAVLAREQAFDPQLAPDPVQARDAMESASLMVGRLQTLHGRLQRRYAEVLEAERLAQYRRQRAAFEKERDVLKDEFASEYPILTAKLVDIFARMTALDAKLSGLRLDGVELTARKMERFTRDAPSLLKETLLFDLHGKQVWPPVVKHDISAFIPTIVDASRSPDWWRPEVQAARAAHAEAEAKRVAEYYANQNREREEREKT